MPIYEYEASEPGNGCVKCARRFEVIQDVAQEPLQCCPDCGRKVIKVISLCRAVIAECSDADSAVERRIGDYEKDGMWSHAAELADKHSSKTRDTGLKMRAIEDYRKAGYDANTLEKHAKSGFSDQG